MANTVRIRNGMSNATEGDILGNFGDLVGVGVVDKANGHLLVTEDSPRGMSIQVAGGIVYVPNADYNQLDSDTPKFYPVVCDAEALTIDNNTSGQTRNDIVCVKVDKSIFPDADASNIATKIVVKGTAGGGIPTTPANHYKLANIVVVNGETEITNAEITDTREQVLLEAGMGVVTEDAEQTLTNKTINVSDNTLSGMLDWFYPIGTIYETTSSDLDTTTKMNNHFGGTWEVYGAGRVLVAKSADTEFDTIGETGGQKTTRHAYPITPLNSSKFQDPGNTYWASVRGDINSYLTGGGSSSVSPQTAIRGVGGEIRTTGTTMTEVTYDRYTATNLQPYIVVYRYRRIA